MPRLPKPTRSGPNSPMTITDPLVIVFKGPDNEAVCHLHPPSDYTHEHYGLLICDLVRHVARAFKVKEDDVWNAVDMERRNPTTDIRNPS